MKNIKKQEHETAPPYHPVMILPPSYVGHDTAPPSSESTLGIRATTDLEAINTFLRQHRCSPNTLRRFGKEIERLLLWIHALSRVRGRPVALRDLKLEDVEDYEAFLEKPPESWCNRKRVRHYLANGKLNPEWRPFVSGLSPSSIKTGLACTEALFGWLHAAGWVTTNPFHLRRYKDRKNPVASIEDRKEQVQARFLEKDHRKAIVDALKYYPQKTVRQRAIYERARYVVHLFLYLTLRLSDAADHTMGDFTQDEKGGWRLKVVGKGGKPRKIVATSRFMEALSRYRKSLGLPPYPVPNEETPLVPDLSGRRAITARQIHNIVKKIMWSAADELAETSPHKAETLRQASSHWMRHTSITLQDDAGIARKYRMLQAGHSKEETARIYEHAEDDAFHEELERLRIDLED